MSNEVQDCSTLPVEVMRDKVLFDTAPATIVLDQILENFYLHSADVNSLSLSIFSKGGLQWSLKIKSFLVWQLGVWTVGAHQLHCLLYVPGMQ